MRDFSTEAIILSKRRQGESDFFIDMLSPDLGKFTIIAKGALKISSKFIGKLEIGQRGIFYIHRTTKNYLILKDIETSHKLSINISTFDDLVTISKIFELLKKIEFQPQLNQNIFTLLSTTLLIINIAKEYKNNKHTKHYETATPNIKNEEITTQPNENIPQATFLKIILLNMLGYLPEFKQCSHCQSSLKDCDVCYTNEGEIFCQNCKSQNPYIINTLTFNQLKLLAYIKSILWDIKKLNNIKLISQDISALELYANNIIVNYTNIKV